jgi:putative FmdB family regulatory protein
MSAMPTYEYRCRTCEDRFELRRPMAESDAPATCPGGHEGAVRLLSVFAPVRGAQPAAGPCGDACACHAG